MRLAVILASNYEQNSRCVPRPGCALDGDLIEDRLAEPDARFALERIKPRRKLKSRLERAFAAVESGDTLVYFSGYARLSDGEPKLVLDDPRGGVFSVGKFRELLEGRPGARLLVFDLLYVEDEDDPTLGIELVDAIRQRFAEVPEVSVMISARPAGEVAPQPGLLTRLLLLTLERAEGERRALDVQALYERMLAGRHYHAGLWLVRQLEFALFDFRMHLEYQPGQVDPVYPVLRQVREEVAVIRPPSWNRFAHAFGHIFAGGYAAGYYSYLWAEVLSADAFAAFSERDVLDPATGSRFRQEILAVGATRPALESFVAFRGREPELEPLLRSHGLAA